MNEKNLKIFIHIGIIISCLAGIVLQLAGSENFMGSALVIFRAFTVQSNLWIAVIAGVALIYELKLKKVMPAWIYTLQYIFTVSILLTYTVFAIILSPAMPNDYLWSPSNWFLHSLTPMLSLMSFLCIDHQKIKQGKSLLFAVIPPIGYAIFFLSYYHFVGSQPVPYFFLDYKVLGWLTISPIGIGVIYWILLISSLVFGLGCGLVKLLNLLAKHPKKHQIMIIIAFSMLGLSLIMTLLNPLFK